MAKKKKVEDLLKKRKDISTLIVHIVRDHKRDKDGEDMEARDILLQILKENKLRAKNIHGWLSSDSRLTNIEEVEKYHPQKTVNFTESPFEFLKMMTEDIEGRNHDFQPYGLIFSRRVARKKGCNPVWYIDVTPEKRNLEDSIYKAMGIASWSQENHEEKVKIENPKNEIFALTPFLERKGPWGADRNGRKEFWWEREWRHVGDMELSPKDVVAVIAPAKEQDAFREKFKGSLWEDVKLLDIEWDNTKVEEVIGKEITDLPHFSTDYNNLQD